MKKNTHSTARLLWDSKENVDITEVAPIIEVERVFPNPIIDCNQISFLSVETSAHSKSDISNRMIQGDNLQIMQTLLEEGYEGLINLIYVDPPYFSDADYRSTIHLKNGDSQESVERQAFKDTWKQGIDSYLDMLYPRLKLMKKLLTDNGSIFVHLDWHVSGYIKLLLDEIFSMDKMVNEIIWCYGGGSGAKRHFHRKHDTIFWYAKGDNYVFNPQYRPYTPGTLERGLTRVKGDKYNLHCEGALMQDWWPDINKILSPTAGENLKFPTQKPAALLHRIISTASKPGDLIADFFAGTGTTASVCTKLERKWIICDNSNLAIQTSKYRLTTTSLPFKVQKIDNNLKEEQDTNKLELLTPVIEKYDDYSVLVRIGIKYYSSTAKTKNSLTDFSSYIEYWAVDLGYNGVFQSDYQIFRENRFKGNISLSIVAKLPRQENYCIAVKVYDVFAQSAVRVIEF
ncbi:MAG: site-specific DNA-methyltransferase [Syntrophomonas sp.]